MSSQCEEFESLTSHINIYDIYQSMDDGALGKKKYVSDLKSD
jgi:hypothetical protein